MKTNTKPSDLVPDKQLMRCDNYPVQTGFVRDDAGFPPLSAIDKDDMSSRSVPREEQRRRILARLIRIGIILSAGLVCGLVGSTTGVPDLGWMVAPGAAVLAGGFAFTYIGEDRIRRQRWFIRELSCALDRSRETEANEPSRDLERWILSGVMLSVVLPVVLSDSFSTQPGLGWTLGTFVAAPILVGMLLSHEDGLRRRLRFARELDGSLERARDVLDHDLVRSVRVGQGEAGAAREVMRQLPQLSIGQAFALLRAV